MSSEYQTTLENTIKLLKFKLTTLDRPLCQETTCLNTLGPVTLYSPVLLDKVLVVKQSRYCIKHQPKLETPTTPKAPIRVLLQPPPLKRQYNKRSEFVGRHDLCTILFPGRS